MANTSTKRMAQGNRAFLAAVLKWTVALNSTTVTILVVWHKYPLFGWQWASYYVSMALTLVLYRVLHAMGYPTTSMTGEVLVPCDLYGQGLHQYVFDMLCVIAASQALSLFSHKSWYLLLLIPGYAFYRTGALIIPMLQGASGASSGVPAAPATSSAPQRGSKAGKPHKTK